MINAKERISTYLEYLDKEMTIMGILSTFCIVSLGLGADKIILSDKEQLRIYWDGTAYLCTFGLAGLLMAGLFFYRQRALLAWYYGQLTLFSAKDDNKKVNELLDQSDGWNTWIYYQIGFGFLFMAISELGCVLLSTKLPSFRNNEMVLAISLLLFWFVLYFLKTIAYKKFYDVEEPEKELLRSIFRRKK